MKNGKFRNKYRIASIRLPEWDYRWAGAYFITICTKNQKHYFGSIQHGEMILSPVGILADVFGHEIKHHAKHVQLGEFVVMPNHIHGVLIICDDAVEPGHALALPRFQHIGCNSVSSIIGSYKSAVTKHANRLKLDFAWQTRFYDHIIRDATSYKSIVNYINNNPTTWNADHYFT